MSREAWREGRILGAIALSALGAVLKLLGAGYGSRALLVDGLTCIGNLVAGGLLYVSIREARRPPDIDHPFGHGRLVYKGMQAMLVIYSFIAGFSAAVLAYSATGYSVGEGASLYALAGTIAYAGSVVLARSGGVAGEAYSGFTASEVLEGVVTTVSAYLGYAYSYEADLAGGVVILGYLVYEIAAESRRLGLLVSDYVTPSVYRGVRRLLEERGFRVKRLRVRMVVPGEYHGDAVVEAPGIPYEVADLLADEAVHLAKEEYGVDLTVHIDVSKG